MRKVNLHDSGGNRASLKSCKVLVGVRLEAQRKQVTNRAMTTTTTIPVNVPARHPDRQPALARWSAIALGSLMSISPTSYHPTSAWQSPTLVALVILLD